MLAKLIMTPEGPNLELKDGTLIEAEQIGYIIRDYHGYTDSKYYERLTSADINFIIDNGIDCDVLGDGEVTSPAEYFDVTYMEGEFKPRYYRGKIIIRLL